MKQIFLYTLEVLELLFRQRTCITQYVVFTLYQSSVFNIVRWALQYLVLPDPKFHEKQELYNRREREAAMVGARMSVVKITKSSR